MSPLQARSAARKKADAPIGVERNPLSPHLSMTAEPTLSAYELA
jgi:hypothetical protein